jgi:hypothetical protein
MDFVKRDFRKNGWMAQDMAQCGGRGVLVKAVMIGFHEILGNS